MKYKYRLDKRWARVFVRFRSLMWYRKRSDTVNLQACKSVALVYPHLIGDIVMVTPFLRLLRRVAPQAEITFIGAGWAKQILDNQHLTDKFICFQNPRAMLGMRAVLENYKDVWQTLQTARQQKFDAVIEPFGDVTATLFASFLRADEYIGVDFSNLSKLQTYTAPYDADAHLVDGLLKLFESCGVRLQPEDYFPQIVLSERQRQVRQDFVEQHRLAGKTVIGIHPGASVDSRRWKGFAHLINSLCESRCDMAICLFCGPGDENFVQDILAQVNVEFKERVITVKRPLSEYMAVLSVCSHVICNDSSCGHITAALGVPVTVLFAQGEPRFIAPRGPNTVNIISRDFPCKPCVQNECPKHTHECFTWITPEIVFETVQNALNGDLRKIC